MERMSRRRIVYRGTVQGVGFRPAVYRTAASLCLDGFVQNRRSEVVVEIEGKPEAVARFQDVLRANLPPAAHIESAVERELDAADGRKRSSTGFRIAESAASDYLFPPIPPDLALCPDCARELLDPADRRYLYPFITCTQCGPRYSIVERTPFDRKNTSMRDFPQCPDCLREYGDPVNRRFHSQTNSCPACGPRLRAENANEALHPGEPLSAAIDALNSGGIVAIQGIGGFHLAADPSHAAAMERLRKAKDRERKPFALMVANLEEARRLCLLSTGEAEILSSPESPIVIAPRRPDSPAYLHRVSDTDTLGIMLPYSPLHLLLFCHPLFRLRSPHLVMTSGNRGGEPIVTDHGEALSKLGDTADLFLFHDRRILFRADDSILRKGTSARPFLLRRSRGFVPRLISLKDSVQGTVLGVGGDLKSAPALARGRDVHLAPFMGDLDDAETFRQYQDQVGGLLRLYGAEADTAVCDPHPLYRSTLWAQGAGFPRLVTVQHHYAHILSVMAEHGLDEAIGLAFDGTGYGTDGTIWGGEFLRATRKGFQRLGKFRPFPLPGGDAAVLHPPRIALAIAADPSRAPQPGAGSLGVPGVTAEEESLVRAMIEKRVNSPLTSSLGRIFDAAAAALGLVERTTYEGEGPIRLEGLALAQRRISTAPVLDTGLAEELLPFTNFQENESCFTIDPFPLIRHLLTERDRETPGRLALLFHEAIAWASLRGARRMRERTGVECIALSGGVFQNLLLREILITLLKDEGFRVFLNERVPPGDGGLSLGQVYHVPQ